ncbi:MAG: Glu/Leu/Phe/Val dehydrogenase [Planctomycetes bacterium]|nr:Glu/Leu/Phe/Val dehydrogenase [Planctomycetota bacterium]
MQQTFLETLNSSDHEQLQFLRDAELGLFAIIAIHDSHAGPAFGGIRRCAYANLADGLRDVLRLSEAMTDKCALAGIPGGGAKAVLLDRTEFDADAAYRLLGRYVENLGGRWYCGPDVGTGTRELGILAEETRFVTVPGPDGPGDLADATARGVLAGLEAVAAELGSTSRDHADLGSLSYAIQGLGEVGGILARELRSRGARVVGSDVDDDRLANAIDRYGVEPCASEEILGAGCDVFVPCALGGILHDLSIERMRFRAICGSANNILATEEHGDQLAQRGVLVAPDYLVNSGALILGAAFHLFGVRDSMAAIDRIGDELLELFGRARGERIAPTRLARRIARERRAAARELAVGPFFPHEAELRNDLAEGTEVEP